MSERVKIILDKNADILRLPAIALRGLVVFPGNIIHFEVGRKKSIAAIEWAMSNNNAVFLTAQQDMDVEDPGFKDLYAYGVVAEVKQVLRVSDELVKVLVEGKYRAKLLTLDSSGRFLLASTKAAALRGTKSVDSARVEALVRSVKEAFEEYLSLNPRLSKDVVYTIITNEDAALLCDYIPANLLLKYTDKQALLNEGTVSGRLEKLLEILRRETKILHIEKDIQSKVNEQMDKNQRDYYLREQMRAISNELDDFDDTREEAEEYKAKIEKTKLPEEAREKLLKEADRMFKMQGNSQEASVIRTYLDTCLDLPWDTRTEDNLDVNKAAALLDKEHYGLKKVKERILEILAVRKLAPEVKGQIICLVGPPGVGKTSIARSIAECLGRKYARMSLGGVRDEAEIRGHRKTYIGAMPGRIMTALIQAKSKNALLLLDEIDKLGSDYKGDPSSALLEVLDSAQNSSFRDHYIEVPFDLSHCMFITTANTTDTIPRALLDRMEVIELGSYTDEEKLQIAKQHLLPKQLKQHGMKRTQVRVSDDAIREIIAGYTRESGVRNLERQLAALCRKCAMRFVSAEPPKRITVTGGNLEAFLGVRKYLPEANTVGDQIGLVTGLAWTAVGGTTLEVEVNVVPGTGKLELTGNLGDVMKESAFAAMSYIRSRAKELGLAPDFYKMNDIHVHFPEGAVPKDGPSAGITICTAIVSALTNRPVRRDVAMTGEISIRGRVLAIGGLKEKTMAALRHGVRTVIIPAENEKDLEEIDQTVRQALQFITVSTADRVLEAALLPAGAPEPETAAPSGTDVLAAIPAPKTRRKPGIRQ